MNETEALWRSLMDWQSWFEKEALAEDARAMAVEHVGTYLALKAQRDALDEQMEEARDAVREILYPDGVKPGAKHVFEGLGVVEGVKGRVTEKLDRARLARAGVAADVLDAATVRTEGDPSMRITTAKGEANAA